MQIWPAIDLRGGKCVRLRQGDYAQETIYGDDPAQVARGFAAAGASHLHLVDLDGARAGRPMNLDSVRAILAAAPSLECELGGGVRDEATIDLLLDAGLSRVVVGTRALREPQWFRTVCRKHPGKLVLGIDARGGRVATAGWLETSDVAATDLALEFADEPLAALIYTDIATDGMLAGPNLEAMAEMRAATRLALVASGGVTRAADVSALAALGVEGAIVGRALYEGTLTIEDALAAARPSRGPQTAGS